MQIMLIPPVFCALQDKTNTLSYLQQWDPLLSVPVSINSPLCLANGTSHFQSHISSHLSRYLCSQDVLLCFHGNAGGAGRRVGDLVVHGRTGHPRLTGARFYIRSIPESLDGIFY